MNDLVLYHNQSGTLRLFYGHTPLDISNLQGAISNEESKSFQLPASVGGNGSDVVEPDNGGGGSAPLSSSPFSELEVSSLADIDKVVNNALLTTAHDYEKGFSESS